MNKPEFIYEHYYRSNEDTLRSFTNDLNEIINSSVDIFVNDLKSHISGDSIDKTILLKWIDERAIKFKETHNE